MRITLGQYIDIMQILQSIDIEDKTSTTLYAEYPEQIIKLLNVLNPNTDYSETKASMIVGTLDIVTSMIVLPEPTEPPAFLEVDGVVYHPPEPLTGIDGEGKEYKYYFGQMEFGDTLEGLRLQELAKGNLKMMPYVLANIYKESEPGDTNTRAKQFLKLDFSDAYNAYFFLSSYVSGYTQNLLNQQSGTTEPHNTSKQRKKQAKTK